MSIQVLPVREWSALREQVRKRPGMYLGSNDDNGLHMLAEELIMNAVDLVIRAKASEIWLTLHPDRSITVADNGSGFCPEPISSPEAPTPASAAEAALTNYHIAGKNNGPDVTPESPHGIGLFVVHALSRSLLLETASGGTLYSLASRDAFITEPFAPVGSAPTSGTSITFTPEYSLFQADHFDTDRIIAKCTHYAFLNPALRFIINDRRTGKRISVHFPASLSDLVDDITGSAPRLLPNLYLPKVDIADTPDGPIRVSLAVAFPKAPRRRIRSFASYIRTPGGGPHAKALNIALAHALLESSFPSTTRVPAYRGFVGAIHLLHPKLRWEGCTKEKVGIPGLERQLLTILRPSLADQLMTHTPSSPTPIPT